MFKNNQHQIVGLNSKNVHALVTLFSILIHPSQKPRFRVFFDQMKTKKTFLFEFFFPKNSFFLVHTGLAPIYRTEDVLNNKFLISSFSKNTYIYFQDCL